MLERRNHDTEKIALHSKQSIKDVRRLQPEHPLRQAIRQIGEGESANQLKDKQWEILDLESKASNDATSRDTKTSTGTGWRRTVPFPRFLSNPTVDPALKRVMVRWCLYKFPVRNTVCKYDALTLGEITNTNDLDDIAYSKLIEDLRVMFNKDQELWGLCKLHGGYVENLRT